MRTSNGCWTCRIRRKKCDELRPICTICAALNITCHFDRAKPLWMDGGVRQDEMARNIKLEIKTMVRRSRDLRQVTRAGTRVSSGNPESTYRSCPDVPSQASCSSPSQLEVDSSSDLSNNAIPHTDADTHLTPHGPSSLESDSSTQVESQTGPSLALDPIHSSFYLDHVFPVLYPFYQPSSSRGGRAWLLELLTTSVAFRQIVLRQSNYFYALVLPDESHFSGGNQVNKKQQIENPFTLLSQSLQTLLSVRNLGQHTHCACRVLTSIIQLYRYEISISDFSNWSTHLDAASTLFRQLVDDCSDIGGRRDQSNEDSPRGVVNTILTAMKSPITGPGDARTTQEAFMFSTALMLFDDIVAGATLRQEPRLYQYHQHLLGGDHPEIELEAVAGVKSWVLKYLGEVASLDAGKRQDQVAGNLDGLAFARRASVVMDCLTTKLRQLQTSSSSSSNPQQGQKDFLEEFHKHYSSRYTPQDTRLVSLVWAHATIIYLITVVSGWQPANAELRYHVDQIVQLLHCQVSAPLIRTMAWPFCVAGCLADPSQKHVLRKIASTLQPTAFFANVHKAMEIMGWTWQQERIWKSDDARSVMVHLDLSACFRSQKELPLLI
ncbi:hypothetical protein NM208_g3511 [Fusarium decemcellulare]|uniref:Uncharacterized protein n=1 Tax=Fusarium decemcellulare TaxID=57161 RepID=A0ACC1SNW9_9HYPO|nr:hypothetical protein NM208_g3511 [Fusarium decemcellulare]